MIISTTSAFASTCIGETRLPLTCTKESHAPQLRFAKFSFCFLIALFLLGVTLKLTEEYHTNQNWEKYLCSYHLVANISVYHISIVNNSCPLRQVFNLHIMSTIKKLEHYDILFEDIFCFFSSIFKR